MGDQKTSHTCLSAETHDARDPLTHYLGCQEFCDRETYLESLKEDQEGTYNKIKTELRRIKYLRGILKSDKDEAVPRLVQNLEKSMLAWRRSKLYDKNGMSGIEAVRQWRAQDRHLLNGAFQQDPESTPGANEAYHPDRDVNAYLISYEDSNHRDDLSNEGFSGQFPNHKMPVSQLLDGKKEPGHLNPLSSASQPGPESLFHYFHLPANNMNVSTDCTTNRLRLGFDVTPLCPFLLRTLS